MALVAGIVLLLCYGQNRRLMVMGHGMPCPYDGDWRYYSAWPRQPHGGAAGGGCPPTPYLLWKIPSWRARIITLAIIGAVAGALYCISAAIAANPQFNLVAHY
jgi:hypothetical protein